MALGPARPPLAWFPSDGPSAPPRVSRGCTCRGLGLLAATAAGGLAAFWRLGARATYERVRRLVCRARALRATSASSRGRNRDERLNRSKRPHLLQPICGSATLSPNRDPSLNKNMSEPSFTLASCLSEPKMFRGDTVGQGIVRFGTSAIRRGSVPPPSLWTRSDYLWVKLPKLPKLGGHTRNSAPGRPW